MIDALMGLEARFREAARVHGSKVADATAKKKEELDSKTGGELKDLCTTKGLKPGSSKEERIERLLEAAKSKRWLSRSDAQSVMQNSKLWTKPPSWGPAR